MQAKIFYPIFLATLFTAFIAFKIMFKGGVIEMDTRSLANEIATDVTRDWNAGRLRVYAHPAFLEALPQGEALKQYTETMRTLGEVKTPVECHLREETVSFQPYFKRAVYLCPLGTDKTNELNVGLALHQDPGKHWQLMTFTVESPLLKTQEGKK